jgi:D-beta-D-heptose 7-phosphate kinase/D-beta-D-heptose 1-phosphate adenosyltransferase
LVRAIRPDFFVKGGDYSLERLPEAALVERLGGQIVILPFVREHSTTNIISRIRSIADDTYGKLSPATTAGVLPISWSARVS